MIYATADALTDFGTRFFPRIARASRQTCRRQGEREIGRSGERSLGRLWGHPHSRLSGSPLLPFSPAPAELLLLSVTVQPAISPSPFLTGLRRWDIVECLD